MQLRLPFACWTSIGMVLVLGCPMPEQPKETPPAAADSGTAAKSQPSSQPSSASTLPSDHSTSSAAVTLEDLFKVPEAAEVFGTAGEEKLTLSDLEQVLRQTQLQVGVAGAPVAIGRFKILDGAVTQLVDRALRRELAKKLGVEADPEYEKWWLADLEQRMADDKSFAVFLLRAGKDAAQRKKDAHEQAIINAIAQALRKQTKGVLEEEAKAYYERNKKQYFQHEGREAWRIFLKAPQGMLQRDRDIARARVEGIHKKASKAKTSKAFENLAISHSEGGKGKHGGYLGWVAKGTFNIKLEKQLFAAKKNTVLPLYEDAHGFYIYYVGGQRPEKQATFEEVKDKILEQIFRPTIEKEMSKRLEELRKSVPVKIEIPELDQLRKEQPQPKAP